MMYEDYKIVPCIPRTSDQEDYQSIQITFYFDQYERSVTCRSLKEVAEAIDDFSTDFCDYDSRLLIRLDGAKVFVPCNFSVQCEVKK